MSKTDYLRVTDYLRHIVEAIERIDRFTTDMTEVQFPGDEKTQDAGVAALKSLVKRVTTSSKSVQSSLRNTMKFLGVSPTKCVMPWRMDTTK